MDWELLEQLGDIHFFLKDLENARDCYFQALRKNNSKTIILKLGKLHLKQGETQKTQELFTNYAENNMLDSQILEELGFIFLSINNRPEALHYLGQAIVQNPQNQDVLLSLGSIAQEYGDTDGAFQRYKEFFELNQNSSEMWSNLGNGYLEKEIYISALSCFKRALYLNPLEWGLYFNLGLVYLTIKVYSVAFHYFLTSIKYNPQNSEAYMLLGVCLNKLQDPANAYNAFEKACTIDPNNHLAFLNMAIFLAEHARDETNSRLAKERFVKHDQLYNLPGVYKDPAIEAQRAALRSILQF